MEEIKFIGITGRKARSVQLDNGEITVVKRLFRIGHGYALYIPTEWLAMLESKGVLKAKNYEFTLWYDEEKLIIEPLKNKVEGRL
jgi:hypothetical protein